MRLIDADSVLNGIEELKKSPWYNRGKKIVKGDPGFQHVGYIERKEAVEVVRDLCIRKEPTAVGWISVKDRLPDAAGYECLVCAVNENYNQTHVFTAHTGYGEPGWWTSNVHYMSRATSPSDNKLHPALKVTHWMPLPEPPKEEEQNA